MSFILILITSLIFSISLIAIVVYFKIRNYNIAKAEKRASLVNEYIINVLSSGESKNTAVVKTLIQKDLNYRLILMSSIVDLFKSTKGELLNKLRYLFYNHGLFDDTMNMILSNDIDQNIMAIRNICYLSIIDYADRIELFLDDKNPRLRAIAQNCYLQLVGPSALPKILDGVEILTIEQQIGILDAVDGFEKEDRPNFKKWLHSSNDSVVKLSLQAILIFNQNVGSTELRNLISHKDESVRLGLIKIVIQNELHDILPLMASKFDNETRPLQLEILNGVAKIGNSNYADMINDIFLQPKHQDLWHQAAKCSIKIEKGNVNEISFLERRPAELKMAV